jgi:hypothetical protein
VKYRRLIVTLAAIAAFAIPAVAAVAPVEQKVVATSRDEKTPAATDGLFAYTVVNRRGVPHARVRLAGQAAKPIGPTTRQTWVGGVDGTDVVIQVISGTASNLQLYDATTGKRLALPRTVNTSLWEYAPTIAHGRLWFLRAGKGRTDGVLTDMTTGRETRVVRLAAKRGTLQGGQIGGHFVTYGSCTGSRCTMLRYDITTGTSVKIPRQSGRYDVAPGVASDGTVYFWRSRAGCGASVHLMRWTPKTGAVLVLALPKGIDAGKTYVYRGHDGLAQVYYERYHCTATGRSAADIYRVVDTADPAHKPA